MTVFRACGLLEQHSVNETPEGIRLSGIATTITPNRLGDTVVTQGAQFKLPLPLLWQHAHDEPVGVVERAAVADSAIQVSMFLPRPAQSAALIERYREATESVRLGLVRGLSIGFFAKFPDVDVNEETFAFTFKKWEWYELSLVTVPANAEATIHSVMEIAEGRARAPAPSAAPHAVSVRLVRRDASCVYLQGKQQ
jgi:HK97 family phage prohead protease